MNVTDTESPAILANTNLSSDEEKVSEPESEILAPETEGGVGEGIVEAVTEEAMRGGQDEPLETSTVEQPQLELPSTQKPKKQTTKTTIMRIQKSLADASKQIEKQTNQINKINQNLQTVQKQFRTGERQTTMVNQIRSQVNRIQKQIAQVHKNVQKRSAN
jgi:small-conductance mechanosensitive channel